MPTDASEAQGALSRGQSAAMRLSTYAKSTTSIEEVNHKKKAPPGKRGFQCRPFQDSGYLPRGAAELVQAQISPVP